MPASMNFAGRTRYARETNCELRARSSRCAHRSPCPEQGLIKVRTTTFNQDGKAVQILVSNLVVPRRQTQHAAGGDVR